MFRRWVAHLTSRSESGPEEVTEPGTEVRAAIDAAKLRDQDLRNQAAKVIAHKIQLSAQIERTADAVGVARAMAKRALIEGEEARVGGDDSAATGWAHTAQSLAVELQSAEDDLASLKGQYQMALTQAEKAREAIASNARKVGELTARPQGGPGSPEQAEMREALDAAVRSMSTSIVDDAPDLQAIENVIERRKAEAMANAGPPKPTEQGATEELRKPVNMAEAEAKLDELRGELGL